MTVYFDNRQRVEVVSVTTLNPFLDGEDLPLDLEAINNGYGTEAERLIEYAGRVCYRSTARAGTAPNFIVARVREGHEDIIEHAWATMRVGYTPLWRREELFRLRDYNRHVEISDASSEARPYGYVSANMRVWRDLIQNGHAPWALEPMAAYCPSVFMDLEGADPVKGGHVGSDWDEMMVSPLEVGPATVTLLAANLPSVGVGDEIAPIPLGDSHATATFLLDGVSRALTHQLVRHRMASFSQESQRYVDLEKGGWSAIIPPKISENPAARTEIEQFWQTATETYGRLRAMGIRKEDARFLLPNAAETRIVVTMNFAAWRHFVKLRAVDKAAQWEIRAVGQKILTALAAIAPGQWHEESAKYQEMRGSS